MIPYIWYEPYRAAALETDWVEMMPKRIRAAESAIHERQRVLSLDQGGTPEERQAIENALRGMEGLRRDVADWLLAAAPPVTAPNPRSACRAALCPPRLPIPLLRGVR